MRGDVQSVIKREGLEKHVEITGWASGDVVRRQIEDSRAFVLPSFAEGLPVVIMEALGRARPRSSAPTSRAFPSWCKTTCAAGWCPQARSKKWRAPCASRSTRPERLTEMGLAGRERVNAMHDANKNAEALLKLFARYDGSTWYLLALATDANEALPGELVLEAQLGATEGCELDLLDRVDHAVDAARWKARTAHVDFAHAASLTIDEHAHFDPQDRVGDATAHVGGHRRTSARSSSGVGTSRAGNTGDGAAGMGAAALTGGAGGAA